MTAITIRIEPAGNRFRWYLRNDYAAVERSGDAATIREALLAIAAIYGGLE